MALTALPTNSPLSVLRAQGINAHFSRANVRVFPRQKVTKDIQTFINTNLLSIVDELNQENYFTKSRDPLGFKADTTRDTLVSNGCLIWQLDDATRAELGAPPADSRDSIDDAVNGGLVA
ncbi:MAG: hypothetical protein WAW61_13055 [Methylococcaceae bacterium]